MRKLLFTVFALCCAAPAAAQTPVPFSNNPPVTISSLATATSVSPNDYVMISQYDPVAQKYNSRKTTAAQLIMAGLSYTPANNIWTQFGTGAVAQTIDAKLRQMAVSILDFESSCGVDDTTAINNAVTAAYNASKPLYAPACLYLFAGPINIPAGLTIFGDGQQNTTFRQKPGTNNSGFVITGAANVTIRDLTLDGNKASNSTSTTKAGISSTGASSNLRIQDVHVTGWPGWGISAGASAGTSGLIVERVTADTNGQSGPTGQDGILVVGFDGAKVINSIAYSNGREGILFGDGGGSTTGASNGWVINSRSFSNGQDGISAVGDGISSVINFNAIDNYVAYNGYAGIHSVGVIGVNYHGNLVRGNGTDGLDVTLNETSGGGSLFTNITGNTVIGQGRVGISVDSGSDYAVVDGNMVFSNGWEGISIFRSANTTVTGNTILNNGGGTFDSNTHYDGIHVWDTANSPNQRPSNNTKIIGNTIADTGPGTQHYGIRFQDTYANSTGAVIEGNSIYGNTVAQVSYIASNILFMQDGGTVSASTGYSAAGSAGVSCAGTPSASFAAVGGIVTHC